MNACVGDAVVIGMDVKKILNKSIPLANRIRQDAVRMARASHASHIGATMSVADIVAVLYSGIANVDPEDPRRPDRDRIVLSKGHAGMSVYAALAETGFFSRMELNSYCANGSRLSGHISHRGVPGVEFSTGSLGHGVCVACGMALAAKIDDAGYRVYAIMGDGENEEGAVWEMALFAAHNKLDNLVVIVDCNRMQAMGFCDEQIGFRNLVEKWRAFDWNVKEISNGNDHRQLVEAFGEIGSGRPTVMIAHTVKGKGVSYMENQLLWHYRDPQGTFFERAIAELGGDPTCETI